MRLLTQKWQAILLSLTLLILLAIPILTWFDFQSPCEAQQSPLDVTVQVNGTLRAKVNNFEGEWITVKESTQVNPSDVVTILAEIKPWPEGCHGVLFVDWELSFVTFSLSTVKTAAVIPSSESFELTLGPQISTASGEDYIVLIVRDGLGQAVRQVSIPLKGE